MRFSEKQRNLAEINEWMATKNNNGTIVPETECCDRVEHGPIPVESIEEQKAGFPRRQ